jgi:hypothetical protein
MRAMGRIATSLLVVFLMLAQAASAHHVRPKGATPLRVALVPAMKECTLPDEQHIAPYANPSCDFDADGTPPELTSKFLTAGTPDANGAGANLVGSIRLDVDVPGGDILLGASIVDVRCMPATAASVCATANAADGPDYSGQLQASIGLRLTDHQTGPAPFTDLGTVVDVPFPATLNCTFTASTTVGGTCAAETSFNAILPGFVVPGKRMSFEIPQRGAQWSGIQIFDGGANGQAGASDATLYLEPGVFFP